MMLPLAGVAAAGVAVVVALWALQLRTRDAATADVGWTILVMGGAVTAGVVSGGDPARRVLVAGLAHSMAGRPSASVSG